MEQSEAAREATRQVEMWIANDGDYFFAAQDIAARHGAEALGEFLTELLTDPREGTPAWYVRQELSNNDLAHRIDWQSIVDDLTTE